MALFQLTKQQSPGAPIETIQFDAADEETALIIARRYVSSVPAYLWSEGRRICRLLGNSSSGSQIVKRVTREVIAKTRA
ncbi:hypothetical protein [Novosphingobium sp. KACC 22771]|uniref:hypothetical protein n=1 Tax=Novosphingobium sp. KACC 22771 TaxID=3025670 RepID=UPI0023668A77|nr:hypothetical protein [Novosphingobium sp. KACC 22771]WDF70888.1 hypothetical protein PQ467_08485 [Novosphingobium sp. KACC 22771]